MSQSPSDARLDELLAIWEQATVKPSPEDLAGGDESLLEELRDAIRRLQAADAALDVRVVDGSAGASARPTIAATRSTSAQPQVGLASLSADVVVEQETGECRIPGFQILGKIGEGGMGSVYRAEQLHPRRQVALKVVRPGYFSHELLRRFEYETAVLGRLEHPGIARIYQAGTANSGAGPQPYFAMELVQGTRLDEYVRGTRPSSRRRLELLMAICQAVHHAHTKGVVHRDLKPANILVTADGQPKVLDFGVARSIDSDIQSTTLHTESGQLIGTLPYMAPEQAAGRVHDLDTTCDVYALGVIGYEMLVGRMPYELTARPLHEAVRVICEEEPSRLSRINRSLGGDVETIVLKAMDKNKSRRYATAGEMAGDIRRYLEDQPISARPPGTWYQFTKFTRRNRSLVGSVAAVFAVLSVATPMSITYSVRETAQRMQAERNRKEAEIQKAEADRQRGEAEKQRAEAEKQRQRAEAVTNYYNQMIASAKPAASAQGREVTVKDLADKASVGASAQFKDDPQTEARARDTIAATYDSLGRSDLALAQRQTAVNLRKRALGDDHPETIASLNDYAVELSELGRAGEAEPILREVIERRRRLAGDDDALLKTAQQEHARVLEMLSGPAAKPVLPGLPSLPQVSPAGGAAPRIALPDPPRPNPQRSAAQAAPVQTGQPRPTSRPAQRPGAAATQTPKPARNVPQDDQTSVEIGDGERKDDQRQSIELPPK